MPRGTVIPSRNTGNSQAKFTEGNDGLALRGLEMFPSSLPWETNRGVICNRRNCRSLTCELDALADSFEPGLVRDRDDSGGHLGIGCSMGLLLTLCRRSSLHLGSSSQILLSARRGPSQGSTACSCGQGQTLSKIFEVINNAMDLRVRINDGRFSKWTTSPTEREMANLIKSDAVET
ncbi:hypothetical protein JB92DRAFT_2834539 [Gautieria morchelliformis]|nr:hypothetical protein JB92DRAFT_2834539 [Gautieria morchelliformis]